MPKVMCHMIKKKLALHKFKHCSKKKHKTLHYQKESHEQECDGTRWDAYIIGAVWQNFKCER